MEVLLLNGSPRAPVSHSKELARMFQEVCPLPGKYRAISPSNHKELCQLAGKTSHLLLVFPLYVDGVPAKLLEFLKALERGPPREKPTISLLTTWGFLEPEQNDTAVETLPLFCGKNLYYFAFLPSSFLCTMPLAIYMPAHPTAITEKTISSANNVGCHHAVTNVTVESDAMPLTALL